MCAHTVKRFKDFLGCVVRQSVDHNFTKNFWAVLRFHNQIFDFWD